MMASEHENDRGPKRSRGRFRSWMQGPFAVAVCVGLAACSSSEEKAQVRFDRGLAAQARGAHTEAVIEFRGALRDDPNRAETHYRLALSLLETKQFGPGVWELDETIRLDPKNLDARIRRAWIALAKQNPDDALAQATAILEADPANLEAALVRIAAHLSKGNLQAAEAESEAAVERWPEEKRAHYDLAQVRNRQGRVNDARASLLRFRELDGNSVAATREVVRFYLATEQPDQAESLLRESIASVAPAERSDLALDLAALLAHRGRDAEAEQVLRSALEAAPKRLDLREQLANVLARTGRLDEAFAATRAGLAIDPSSRALRLQEADALLRLGDLEGGERASGKPGSHCDSHEFDQAVEAGDGSPDWQRSAQALNETPSVVCFPTFLRMRVATSTALCRERDSAHGQRDLFNSSLDRMEALALALLSLVALISSAWTSSTLVRGDCVVSEQSQQTLYSVTRVSGASSGDCPDRKN